MNQASAVVGGSVVSQIDRAKAVIGRVDMGQRVFEADAAQVFAFRGGDDAALQRKTLQAFLDQRFGQYQQATRRVDQCVNQFGVEVQSLIGRDGPGGGGPDHGKGFFGERFQTECVSQFVGLSAQKPDIQRL